MKNKIKFSDFQNNTCFIFADKTVRSRRLTCKSEKLTPDRISDYFKVDDAI